jgi:hypothetical protein
MEGSRVVVVVEHGEDAVLQRDHAENLLRGQVVDGV